MSGVSRRLVTGLLTLALLAGCTSFTDSPGNDGSSAGTGLPPSSDDLVGDLGADGGEEREPSSSELIAAALAAGEIDEPTALLYRTWLYFGDAQLPERFVGEMEPREYGLIDEVRDKVDDMPGDIRAQVERYLRRPADPKSAFNSLPAEPASDSTQTADNESNPAGLRGAESGRAMMIANGDLETGGIEDSTDEPARRCETGWDTEPVDPINFRVWACKDADALRGMSTERAMTDVATMLQKYVPKMTADMGEFIPDDPSMQSEEPADDRIDVYILPTGWLAPARGLGSFYAWLGDLTGAVEPESGPNYASAVSSPPEDGVTASSYLLISSDHFYDKALLERMVVHELFHALQNTHNARLDAQWWNEGSAEWAASYYVRSDSARLHRARLPVRQNSRFSLLTPRKIDDLGPYGAYLWPLFMEQQEGAQAVFSAWKAMAGLERGAGNETVLAVLNEQLNVADNFAEFTMRTFNQDLPSDPIKPRFVDLDGNFPDRLLPQIPTLTLSEEQLEIGPLGVHGLGHAYFDVEVPAKSPSLPDSDVSITIRSDLATSSDILPTLEALVRSDDGSYERQRISYVGDGVTVCVSENLKLVLANQSTDEYDRAEGSIFLERNYDQAGQPRSCTRVEASHPEAFSRLADGEVVAVHGTEGDGKPDVAPVLITVRDVPVEDVSSYQVQVTLTGGTLDSAREFTWPLTDFDVLVPGKKYRKGIDVTLDKDLTDANRPLTIDTRLVQASKNVDSHAPTIELRGKQEAQCFADVTITGQVKHRVATSGAPDYVYRSYPIDLSERLEPPLGLSVLSLDDHEDSSLQIFNYNLETDLTGQDIFELHAPSFGNTVPVGETGTFTFDARLVYRDYTNVPWALLDEGTPLPDRGLGQPEDPTTSLEGELTLDVTKSTIDEHLFENWDEISIGELAGTLSGTFRAVNGDGADSMLTLNATFEHSSRC